MLPKKEEKPMLSIWPLQIGPLCMKLRILRIIIIVLFILFLYLYPDSSANMHATAKGSYNK